MEKIYQIKIKGLSPLLQNRYSGEKEQKSSVKRKSETNRENEIESTIYRDTKGRIVQPSEHLRQAIIQAGKNFKKGKSNLSNIVAAFCLFLEDEIVHENQDYSIDRRSVVIPSTHGRIMRNRARLDDWTLSFAVKVLDDKEIDGATLKDILDYAGKYIGIGDYRPQHKGIFGRFMVVSFAE